MNRMKSETAGTINIEVQTEGFEEAQEKIEALVDAYDGFPPQVTIKNCHDCTINVYPSQMRNIYGGGEGSAERGEQDESI